MLSQCNDSSFLFLPDFDIFRKNKKKEIAAEHSDIVK